MQHGSFSDSRKVHMSHIIDMAAWMMLVDEDDATVMNLGAISARSPTHGTSNSLGQ